MRPGIVKRVDACTALSTSRQKGVAWKLSRTTVGPRNDNVYGM